MRACRQLTQEPRDQMQAMLNMGHVITPLAEVVGAPNATINRAVRRNAGRRGYHPQHAHRLALVRQ